MKVFNKKWLKYWKKLPKGLKYHTVCDPGIKGTDFSLSFGVDKKGNYYIVKRIGLDESI